MASFCFYLGKPVQCTIGRWNVCASEAVACFIVFKKLKLLTFQVATYQGMAIRITVLIPHFGPKLLTHIRLEDGLAYLEKRRLKAAEGTMVTDGSPDLTIRSITLSFDGRSAGDRPVARAKENLSMKD